MDGTSCVARRGIVLALAALAGCGRPVHSTPTRRDVAAVPVDVPIDAGAPRSAMDAGAAPVFVAWAEVARASGVVALDSTLRIPVVGGVRVQGEGTHGVRPGQKLYPGDVVTTGPSGEAVVRVGQGGTVVLGHDGEVAIPTYAGAAMVLLRGMVELSSTGDPLRVDTPAGRVIVSSGRATCVVTLDGSTAARAVTTGVTLWPSPEAPPPRRTARTREERERLRASAGNHPISLDVDLPEIAAQSYRPVASRAMAPGDVSAWDPLGAPEPHAPESREGADGLRRWATYRDADVLRPGGHLTAIGALSRAGAGDLADARVAFARLRTSDAGRGDLLGVLSLALGRATARAGRGRDLAVRGGDVTALVQVARLEELRDAAWVVAPLDATGDGGR